MDNENRAPQPMRYGVEWAAAILSGFSVAPVVSILDKAIVSNASGKEKLLPSIKSGVKSFFKRPVSFFRQPAFLLVWGVYSGTYIVANSIELFCIQSKRSEVIPKFVGSFIANTSLSMFKDKMFAQMFGVGISRPFPPLGYAMFVTRDGLTILASFTLPKPIGKSIHERSSLSKQTSENIAQLIVPCMIQFVSTPIHLYALDRYNRPEPSVTHYDRFVRIGQEYVKTVLARIARILPAFGIGGILNTYLRRSGRKYLRRHYNTE